MAEGKKTCCFFGHRKISDRDQLRKELYRIIEELITHDDVSTFLFGSKSEFDSLCREAVALLKEKYPHIHRIYIRAEYQYINKDYEKYLLQFCDETYFSTRAVNSGKAVYIERNYELIDKSDICVVYYNPDYLKTNNYQSRSGTHIAYEYAVKKDKRIICVI